MVAGGYAPVVPARLGILVIRLENVLPVHRIVMMANAIVIVIVTVVNHVWPIVFRLVHVIVQANVLNASRIVAIIVVLHHLQMAVEGPVLHVPLHAMGTCVPVERVIIVITVRRHVHKGRSVIMERVVVRPPVQAVLLHAPPTVVDLLVLALLTRP